MQRRVQQAHNGESTSQDTKKRGAKFIPSAAGPLDNHGHGGDFVGKLRFGHIVHGVGHDRRLCIYLRFKGKGVKGM